MMISIEQAHQLVAAHVQPLSPRRLPLPEAFQAKLAEDVASPFDSPPFDKSTVDGFAIQSADAQLELAIVEQVTAGHTPKHRVAPGVAARLMTGAPLPEGADAVVKIEDCTLTEQGTVIIPHDLRRASAHVLSQGKAFRKGDKVLSHGDRLTPAAIGLLAELGYQSVVAQPPPRIAILPTGDELAAPGAPLRPGEIYNSNGPMLAALISQIGGLPIDLGVAVDDPEDLHSHFLRGLDYDVLLIAGGVSAGVKDLAPGILEELGVQKIFHKIRMRPGKPLWFGKFDHADRTTYVFGLPGNPVSALTTARLFVAPTLASLAGCAYAPPTMRRGRITCEASHRGRRPTYHPFRWSLQQETPSQHDVPGIEPLAWQGSADLAAMARADGWIFLPEGDYDLAAGSLVDVVEIDPRAAIS
ncbi:MAG: molybdopterin molybdotransferase MoeA [Planctomycetales bacterium]|nr:molybdopterin molybdotransferase MoeA [Planctomycetales bacterium]